MTLELFSKLLCPPGYGVHTIHTAAERKNKLNNLIYKEKESLVAKKMWEDSFQNLEKHTYYLLGITSDTGGGIQRGANWGPLFIREQLYQNKMMDDFFDLGDIKTIPHLLHDKYLNAETITNCREALYQDNRCDLPVSPLSIAEKSLELLFQHNQSAHIFSLGGDHSVSYPMVKTWLRHKKLQKTRTAVIHFDAHTDLLNTRLGIDLCFGSWAFHILEELEKPSDLIQIGIRSSGKPKEHWESTLGIQQLWSPEIQKIGLIKSIETLNNYLTKEKIQEVYISCDIDVLDKQYANATGTPEENGLAPYEVCSIIESISPQIKVTGADLVEVAPMIYQTELEPTTTLMSATQIIQSLFKVFKRK
jgi:agmatinase